MHNSNQREGKRRRPFSLSKWALSIPCGFLSRTPGQGEYSANAGLTLHTKGGAQIRRPVFHDGQSQAGAAYLAEWLFVYR